MYIKTALPNQVIILTFVDLKVCESLMWEVYLVNKNLRRVTQDAEKVFMSIRDFHIT